MLEYITGTLGESSPQKAVVENGGLGYGLTISIYTFQELPQKGSTVKLYIASVIREDAHKFFGFLTHQERDTFYLLINISGVGPKVAMAILGHLPLEDLQLAVHHSNTQAIAKVPGIGKKTAERLIIELRDKFKTLSLPEESSSSGIADDAISALTNLGYHPVAAQRAVRLVLGESTPPKILSDLISLALKSVK
ncbi:MAG: Holliday junction ATP-dependent DNA helicase RuvA [Chlamydiae bacterium]|nr:Holliday junction ATP-dependent DNA helicase RuvA [Chlamydiota bacterium]